jgi:hypothetical protein
MKNNQIYLGNTVLDISSTKVEGEFVNIQNEKFYKITNYDQMADFFMTIVSDSDHWIFISSNGSLSAGRKNRDNALFPYYTVDKIHDYCGITGSKTIVRVEMDEKIYLWEPFAKEMSNIYQIERNLYKSEYGNKVIYEEINKDLGIGLQYGWYTSEKFGIIKKSVISNRNNKAVSLEILDGISNILPSGIDYDFQNEYSNLLDSYKKNELLSDTGLGLYLLSSIPVDRPEPSESLTATTVWSKGLINNKILISSNQLDNFRKGLPICTETDVRAARGAYFISASLDFEKDQSYEWIIASEINQSSTDVANLNTLLGSKDFDLESVNIDIQNGTTNLIKKVAGADGLQITNEELCSVSHFSKTMFNILRGGTYPDSYTVNTTDFKKFVHQANKRVGLELETFLAKLPGEISIQDLIGQAAVSNKPDFMRICYEYLPLSFSRRHGDPSRPWNIFSIENKNSDGSEKLDYQGNWRDIFQNWEALSLSYPEYIENIISKFVNASTSDGYNPYRIMRNGIDWESPDANDPWAYIGYWGDHQIIYLQKLLEISNKYHPGKLEELLFQDIFTYANVPYRIKSYNDIKKNPKETIDFDYELNEKITGLVNEVGSDGRLLLQADSKVYHVNLAEKILVTLLAKLSNFIPEAGIWLNTQRPEWNDANNALVGNGASMVTLYYLRRFLQFWNEKFSEMPDSTFKISEDVRILFDSELKLFSNNISSLKIGFSDKDRLLFADTLGESGELYRNSIYKNSFSTSRDIVGSGELTEFTLLALKYIDQSISANKRGDGLYHSYNLISFNQEGVSIRHLYEMLEGQVAVLSSGYLSSEESLDVLDALKESKLFREDQYSYLLYPDRELPRFIEKNNISKDRVQESKLLLKLIANKDLSILSIDTNGQYHFNETFRNAEVLNSALSLLDSTKYGSLVNEEKAEVLNLYEEVFDHKSFTGRSGTFYGYEGLGSIYWHMVSKLLLAVEECFFNEADGSAESKIIGRLKDHYYEIKAGIGLYKSPELYGAFPTDAYSHTPGNAGVKQPGMTGQVKEDIISRMGELGVRVIKGKIIFDTGLINENEFLENEKKFTYFSSEGKKKELMLKPNQLGFTMCQVPVVYTLNGTKRITVSLKTGKRVEIIGDSLNIQMSSRIFNRTGEIELIQVEI